MRLRSKAKKVSTVSQKNKPPAKRKAVGRKKTSERKRPPGRPPSSRRRRTSETESEESSVSDSDSFEAILALNETRPYVRPKSKSTESEDRDDAGADADADADVDADVDSVTEEGVNEEWLCGFCDKEVRYDDDGILCEAGCDRWFHRQCVKLTKLAYQLLQKEMSAEWACDGCIATGKVKQKRKGLKQ